MAKLRNGWKSHGTSWKFNETPWGGSIVSVVQFTERGQKRFDAHYWDDRIAVLLILPPTFGGRRSLIAVRMPLFSARVCTTII